jgi:hypothetical protein
MIAITDEQDFDPEIFVERMLGLQRREIIAGRDDAAIKDNEVVFAGRERDRLLRTGAKSETG